MLPNYRRCISCRKADHKSAFWRVVRVFPTQQVQLDQGMGRSVYLCPQVACLQAAQKKDRLGRVLKVTVPAAIYQTLWQRLTPEHPNPNRLGKNLPEGECSE
jgi:predicted RNA-binding protein YlxR (DUF448 family)